MKNKYDYIIAGAGCAGLSLAMHIMDRKEFADKKVLIIDKDQKSGNDRTWCFWEKGKGFFEQIIHKQWEEIAIVTDHYYSQIGILPYRYKMIRSLDFYNYCLQSIHQHPNFEFIYASIDHLLSSDETTGIMLNGAMIESEYVFNSIPPKKPELNDKEYWLWQHFKGWLIQTPTPHFNDSIATLMDFRVHENDSTAFCYCLPLSPSKALVEYTLFSKNLADSSIYEQGLMNYIHQILLIENFEILESEQGKIPMTNYYFDLNQNNIINIGTTGGQTKGSTGYTFNFIQKHSKQIVDKLIKNQKPIIPFSSRFRFYDSVLLRVLNQSHYPADLIFEKLFSKNKVQTVFRFLDNESTIQEDLSIISSLPFQPFLKAAVSHIF